METNDLNVPSRANAIGYVNPRNFIFLISPFAVAIPKCLKLGNMYTKELTVLEARIPKSSCFSFVKVWGALVMPLQYLVSRWKCM